MFNQDVLFLNNFGNIFIVLILILILTFMFNNIILNKRNNIFLKKLPKKIRKYLK